MGKKEPEPADPIDTTAWMITFSDLLTLMLTFFVLLFSMSSLDARSLKEVTDVEALAGGDGVLTPGKPVRVEVSAEPPKVQLTKPFKTQLSDDVAQYLRRVGRGMSDDDRRRLEERILERAKQDKVEVHFLENGLEIAFEETDDAVSPDGTVSRTVQGHLAMVGTAAVDSGARVRVVTNARGDDLGSWMTATHKASALNRYLRRTSGISKRKNRLAVAPTEVGGPRKVRMVLELPDRFGRGD
jgi:flagellar motor protein MotB